MNKLLVRTISGAVYVALVLLSIYSYALIQSRKVGFVIFVAFFFLVAMVGVYEVFKNLRKKGESVNQPMGWVVAIVTYMIATVSAVSSSVVSFNLLGMLPMLWLLVALTQLWRHDERPFATIGYSLLPTLWVVLPLALLQRLWILHPFLVLMVFVALWVNDTFAYLTGMAIGKHHMWVRHSPNKTWEGTIGGAVFCMVAVATMGCLCYNSEHFYAGEIAWWQWLCVGLLCSVAGTLGDLTESMFKRFCGVKDSGNIMPGHGGVLDRFDSVLMSVPIVMSFLALCRMVLVLSGKI